MPVEMTSDVPTVKRRSRSIGQNKSIGDTAVIPPAPSKYGREISSWQAGVPDTAGDTSASRQVASISWVTPSKKEQEKRYLADLHAAIAGKKFYPEQARREGREGRVVVGITIRRDGEITNVTVVEPSGSRLLDRAASKAVRQLGRFRPFSNRIVDSALTTQIAFTYRLEN
jgi:TonB family protein